MGNRRFPQFYRDPLQPYCNDSATRPGNLNDTSESTRSEGEGHATRQCAPDRGVFTPEQKSEMIHQLTETMVRIEGENLRPVTWVIVEEVKSGDWGIGGKGLTAADVHALQGKAPAGVPG
jgi:4-oxalocrotonate tautomerase